MKTINTIDDALKILREPIPYMEPDEDLMKIAEWLEELKDLRVELEKNSKELVDTKGVVEFQQKSNIERGFRIKELEQELEVYKKAYQMACDSLSDKTACEWGYDEVCKACQEEGMDSLKTTSCADHIKNYYLKESRKEE